MIDQINKLPEDGLKSSPEMSRKYMVLSKGFSYHYDLLITSDDNTQKHKILAKIQQNKDKKCVRDGIL